MTGPTISSYDRLSATFFLAAVTHALVILGIGFTSPEPKGSKTPPLIEVTLATQPIAETPRDYDYLAQANQDGGGESEDRRRPRDAATASISADAGLAPTQTSPATSAPSQRSHDLVSTRGQQQTSTPQPASTPDAQPPTPAELISDSQQTAQAVAFQHQRDSVDARYPSKRYINARTKAHAAADYLRRWAEKVEQVGNLNYPEEARRRGLSGSLTLEVTLRPDGSMVGARILDSSRQPVLDQAALRIIHIAAPFLPVPAEVLAGSDLLVIVRTLEFVHSQGVTTGN